MSTPADGDPGEAGTPPAGLVPPPPALLDDPLEFMLGDHFRQRSLCALMRDIAQRGTLDRAALQLVVANLTSETQRHHSDEDEDLFPALRHRARPEDDLEGILARLEQDHRETEAAAQAIVAALEATPAADPLVIAGRLAEQILAFTASTHRHLTIENGIVLVIARKRLKASDLRAISRRMKARRGIAA